MTPRRERRLKDEDPAKERRRKIVRNGIRVLNVHRLVVIWPFLLLVT